MDNKPDLNLIYTGDDLHNNWFYNRYYYSGANCRYHTFQTALNLLNQLHPNPTIVETGCQRLKEDLGGGMSTSIFANYIKRYGGRLLSVDISPDSVQAARNVLSSFSNIDADVFQEDSVAFLKKYKGECSLLYLDSYDYPYGKMLEKYGGKTDINAAAALLKVKTRKEIVEEFVDVIRDCQHHCLQEFKAIEKRLSDNVILLVDDNQLVGGGKPRLLKRYLVKQKWICLSDFQQSLWVKQIPAKK